MKCHILKLELVDKWHNWLRHICDMINDVTEVRKNSKIDAFILYFPLFIPVCFI